MAKRLYLMDGSAFAFRSFFAIAGLTNSKGEPTNAVFGFARALLKLLREQEPSHIAAVFDAPGKTFREDLYADYKATRQETPPDLVAQMPRIDACVEAFDIPLIRIEGVEADDVMGTLAWRAEAEGYEVVLVSGDKDLLQLVTERVRVYDPHKGDDGAWYGPAEVKERFGVPPENVVDALGLMGDSSDNVPGVRGIGPKTARKLLEKYGTIDGLYEHLDDLKGKQREKLEEDRELAMLSRQLVTIDTQVDLDLPLDSLERQPWDETKLAAFFHEMEFHSLAEEFAGEPGADEETDYQTIATREALDTLVRQLRDAGEFALDTETTSIDAMQARLVGISVSTAEGTGFYIPVGHTASLGDEHPQLDLSVVKEVLGPVLADPAIGKTGHNIKYDLIVLERAGLPVAGVAFDTMVGSYLTDPSRLRHNLSEVSLHYLNRPMIPIEDLIGRGSRAVTFDTVPIERACVYAAEDADIAWRLTGLFRARLSEEGLERLFEEVELPLVGVLARMEMAGIALDGSVFSQLHGEVTNRLAQLEEAIYESAGERFQINSPKQLQAVLFDRIGLKPLRKTKTGYSTDMEVLGQLALEHPLPQRILDYRGLEKLRSAYIDVLPQMVNPDTGRLHTSYNQAVAATGRLSSSDPNLQNIPVRTELGRRIREGFVAQGSANEEPYVLISADYSQVELRVLAHLSDDAGLLEAFEDDRDIHRDTAARVFGVMPELVDVEMRRRAKAVNFGVIYGISAYGLSRNLGIPPKEAGKFIDAYFEQYPGVRRWIDATIAEARKKGFVTTLLGRKRYVANLDASNNTARQAAERVAMNTPVQGTAADIIKLAMVRLEEALAGTKARMLLQVHDELIVEAPAREADKAAAQMDEIMAGTVDLRVPLKVDTGIGKNWAEAH